MKRKDGMAIRAGIWLSYKQEIAKIITEYPNDKRGIKGTSYIIFCVCEEI